MAFGRVKKPKDNRLAQERIEEQQSVSSSHSDAGTGFAEEFKRVWGDEPVQDDIDGKVMYNLSRREIADSPQPTICFTQDDGDVLMIAYHDCIRREIDGEGQVLTLTFSTGDIIACEGEGLLSLREALQQNRVKHLYRFKPQVHVLEDGANGTYISRMIVSNANDTHDEE